MNQGAWLHLFRYEWSNMPTFVGRKSSASPATGFKKVHDAEQAENLHRKLLNAIRLRDPNKFSRSVRRTNEK